MNEIQNGAAMIAAERQRQIDAEGWTPEHDDKHMSEELAFAAAVYAWPSPRPHTVKRAWPWDKSWWRPAVPELTAPDCGCRSVGECGHFGRVTPDAVRAARLKDLVRAGALVAAEIDRLNRAALAATEAR